MKIRTFATVEADVEVDVTLRGEFIDFKCPKCRASLLFDGDRVWCSFVGGGTEKGCDFGIREPVLLDELDTRV